MKLSELTFHVPPECAGQMIEVAYTRTPTQVFRRTRDEQQRVSYDVSSPLAADEGDYWNEAPRNRRWREIVPSMHDLWPVDD